MCSLNIAWIVIYQTTRLHKINTEILWLNEHAQNAIITVELCRCTGMPM